MTALHQYISAIGSFQGVMLFFLLVSDRKTTAASKVLGSYCLLMGLAFFLPFITFGVASSIFNPLAAWLFFLPVLYGAFMYLYCSKVIFNAPFKAVDLVHLSPLLVCYAVNADSLFFHHEEMRLWVVGAPAPTKRLWWSEYLLFGFIIVYLIATVLLIKRYHKQASDTLSNFNPSVFLWLKLLVSSFILIVLVKGVMAFSSFAVMTLLVLSDAMIVLIITIIALTHWKTPQFFVINDQENQGSLNHSKEKAHSDSGTIDQATRALMFEELKQHLEQELSYRNSELSLASLADSVGISPHHLSEVLNQHAGQNFNQFINAYRIKEVCEKLNSPSSLKVLDVAMQAGFSSKSTFNTIFKKFMGLTPTQYRQQFQD